MERLSRTNVLVLVLLGIAVALLALVIPPAHLSGVGRTVMFAGAVMSLNLLVGNAGLISIGHGLFLGLGAYAVAIANITYGIAVGWAALIAISAAFVMAAITGAIALRARHLFFALLTLALGQVAFIWVSHNYDLTGGDDGLIGIEIPLWLWGDVQQYLLAVISTTLICLAMLVLLASPFGAALRAVRDNPQRVASLGQNPKIIEFAAFVISGVFGTLSGVIAALIDLSVSPETFSWVTGATLLVMVALGGRFSFYGPIVGVIILETSRTLVQMYSTHADLVVGLLVVLCAVLVPEGIVPPIKAWFAQRALPRPEPEKPALPETKPATVRSGEA